MTKKQCLKKIRVMMRDDKEYLIKECTRLLNTGGVEVTTEPKDSFAKAISIYYIALLNLSYQREPLSHEGKKDANNLKHF